ncbi:phosphatase PAP2 family protein [Sphingobium sp. CAP-1]|uniref:phosphatase PAP2 family protein n=1 Tax=Sphingobium sp. CAP-1 TaxID=2676077 RepID=UPI0012BB4314|nr:phosphatase PAP2 family protein [Sphingobium sp. CAP-1]QGP78616.1 PAP2 family protein [Sphingobium sp. CAP-1]
MQQTHPTPNRHPNGRDDAAWLLLGLTGALIVPLQLVDPFAWSIPGLIAPCGFALLLGALAFLYARHRPDPKIFAMLTGLQGMLLFSAIGASLSYMIAARTGPLWDARLAEWDRAMGMDWPGWLHWMNAHPLFATALSLAYRTLIPQMIALILVLGLCGRLAALRIVMQAAMIAGLTIILLSGLMPAASTYVYYDLKPADFANLHPAAAFIHMPDFTGLRDGTLRVLALDRMAGLISFPSYHGALAVIFCWGFSRATVAAIRHAGMVIALLTLIATPVDGGHYFSDVIAGVLVAVISLAIARRTIHLTIRLRPAIRAGASLAPAT